MSKKRGLFGFVLKGAGVVAGLAAAAYGTYYVNKKVEDHRIALKIKTFAGNLVNNSTIMLNFKDIVPEEWDLMHVFPALTSCENIEAALGFNWDDVYKTNISFKSDVDLLVFVRDSNVARYIEYPKIYGDFSSLDSEIFTTGLFSLTKEEEKFIIREASY